MKINCFLGLSTTVLLLTLNVGGQERFVSSPLETPKRPVVDTYHGIKVTDDYRWLENWDDPQVKQWSSAQNARSREYLDHLATRPAIRRRLEELINNGSTAYYDLQFRGGTLFAMRDQPPQQQPVLVDLPSADEPGSAKVVFDANTTSAGGSLSVDFYVPSLNGKFAAVVVSKNGSEDGSAEIFEAATGKQLPDIVPRVNFATAAGSIAWKRDDSGFYYTRYPQGNERPAQDADFYQQVYFHKLGTDANQDAYIIGKDFPRIAEIQLQSSEDGKWLLASVSNGDANGFAHYVMDAASHWTQITHFEDGIVSAKLGPDDALYLLSRKDAPRGQILRLPLSRLALAQARVVVPQSSGSGSNEEGRVSIESFVPAPGHLYVVDILGGPSRVRVFDLKGHPLAGPILPPVSAVGDMLALSGGDVLFEASTYLEPSAWYRFDARLGKSVRTKLFQTSAIQFDDAEVVREFATSKDGTRVPLNIIRRRDIKLDGSNPALLEGYGGYRASMQPHFLGTFARIWLDNGGVFVISNLRGGTEYGEDWHTGGNLTHKQNVFDDFIAGAQHLIGSKYTSPEHFAILGRSNGGLLMGAALTQRPDLFRAVVSFVGIYDMLRVELDPNGVFNIPEYGTVKDPDQFKALYAYSPYHHVVDGTPYPAVLLLTGENDHRVNPMQSRKMTARLQAATRSGRPILLRTSSSGHGFGTGLDERSEEDIDVLSFLFEQLGMQY